MSTAGEDRIKQIKNLTGTPWNLWKFHQERVDEIRTRLWTTGTWLIALMGALLVALAHEGEIVRFQPELPGVAILKPWLSLFIAAVGLVLVRLMYLVVRDNVRHLEYNYSAADYLWSERWLEAKLPQFTSNVSTLKRITLLFLIGYALILGLSLWSLIWGGQAGQAAAAPPRQVTLLTINDVYRIEGVERGQRGGLARVRSLRQQLEAEDPELLLLHAGDVIYPSLLSRTYDGAQMIDILNRLDGNPADSDPRMFAVLGNHEFDKPDKKPNKPELVPADVLADRIRASQFTWLRSNVAFALDPSGVPEVRGQENLHEWQIIKPNGVKVGLFGLTTNVSRPDYVVEIGDPLENARRFSRELRDRGADLVIALTHLTVRQDMAILRELGGKGPDLIIGGHEHTKHKEEVEGRWVLKADAEAVGAWVVRVTPRPGEPPLVEPEYRTLAGDLPLPDEAVQQKIEEWHARHNEEFCREEKDPPGCLDVKIGETATVLVAAEEQIRSCETNFGSWIADQARAAFPGAQAAFVNAGSLRLNQNISPGPILRRDLEELFQYDNQLVMVPISGKTLREVVENAVTDWPGNGRWLQISGFAFEHDQTNRRSPKVEQLQLIEPDGTRRPPRDDETVQVVTTDYLLGIRGDGGDRDDYDMLPKMGDLLPGQEKKGLRKVVRDALVTDGKSIDPPDPATMQRIVQIKPEPPCIAAE